MVKAFVFDTFHCWFKSNYPLSTRLKKSLFKGGTLCFGVFNLFHDSAQSVPRILDNVLNSYTDSAGSDLVDKSRSAPD
jgi:hypothetical protein